MANTHSQLSFSCSYLSLSLLSLNLFTISVSPSLCPSHHYLSVIHLRFSFSVCFTSLSFTLLSLSLSLSLSFLLYLFLLSPSLSFHLLSLLSFPSFFFSWLTLCALCLLPFNALPFPISIFFPLCPLKFWINMSQVLSLKTKYIFILSTLIIIEVPMATVLVYNLEVSKFKLQSHYDHFVLILLGKVWISLSPQL